MELSKLIYKYSTPVPLVFTRGLTNYNAEEARLIAQHASKEIETLFGYGGDAEIIHRDNLVLLRDNKTRLSR